jgi:predicted Holliday junction resolvase-like endonuclease
MFFFDVLEILLVVLVFVVILFQVILPIWQGTVLFPSFRTRARDLERQLRQARLDIETLEEEKQLHKLQGEIGYEKQLHKLKEGEKE